MFIKKLFCFLLLYAFTINVAQAGVSIVKSNGITLTGADTIDYIGTDGITLTGADNFLSYQTNGITLTGADGITLTGADGITLTGADGSTYTGTNGITLTGADGITLTGADGITLTGADGITLTGADGVTYRADSITVRQPNGITLTGADGITLTGADGINRAANDGITLTGADGITLTGADGITLTGADGITGINSNGVVFSLVNPTGITLTGADGITLTGADGITLTGADGITLTGADDDSSVNIGLQSVDPELAVLMNNATDDSNINAVIVFHQYPSQTDLTKLQQIGIAGGTKYNALPMVVVTATRRQLIEVSRLPQVRSIYGNRTLTLNSDPFFKTTQVQRASIDRDLQSKNAGNSLTGKNVTVAVLDTGVNSLHSDLSGKVIQNVRLADVQSTPLGFISPVPVENLPNTDLAGGHGTFVAGVIAASGASSNGKYNGVAPGANILGLSAGDLNLSFVLAGFDYLLSQGANYNVRVINCSFSANTVFDYNDPVNIATKIITGRGINVVFSAGNSGAGNGTLNPYAAAPWVVSVGATDEKGNLASYSSRGVFGSKNQNPTLVAPGTNIVSLRGAVSETSANGLAGADSARLTPAELPYYTTASGTSFSAPQVAGAIALMLETNPNLKPAQIKDILQRTATPTPQYFRHEAGAGMLNTYAAVLEAAFPERRMGIFRSVLNQGAVNFTTSASQIFQSTVNPNTSVTKSVLVPADTIQAGVHIGWDFSSNDLALKLYDSNGIESGTSNYANAPGLSGRREKVILNYPGGGDYLAVISHTGNLGTTAQKFTGIVETTRADYAQQLNLSGVAPFQQAIIKEGLRSFLVLPKGQRFQPNFGVTRAELAAALLRTGRVPQYLAGTPMFTDVRDVTTRNIVESVQSSPNGKLFFDAPIGGAFRPDTFASKLVTAIALVKAANLESLTSATAIPLSVSDRNTIPVEWRGYVAVALSKGLMNLDGYAFNSNRAITQMELAQAVVILKKLPLQ
ncbi:MAG: S8 family serine peptidase [Pyrinomonadaceae bacterium]